MDERRRRRGTHGAVFHLIFAVALLGGLLLSALGVEHEHRPTRAEVEQTQRCSPVTVRPGEEDAARTLVDAGWVLDDPSLYPPGCEGVR